MERWEGRVALVTGASSGIGTAIAKCLVKHKMTVIGCGRQISRLQKLSQELSAKYDGYLEPVKCDVRQESDIKNMFNLIESKYGGLDVCINNAGLYQDAPLLSGDTESWREMLEVNILGLTIITREAYQSMMRKGVEDGQLINVCSLSGHRLPTTNIAFYPATKFAVRALTEGVRRELRAKKSKVRMAEISPGVVETEIFARGGGEEFSNKVLNSVTPLKSEDVADGVLYILSAPPLVEINEVILRSVDQSF